MVELNGTVILSQVQSLTTLFAILVKFYILLFLVRDTKLKDKRNVNPKITHLKNKYVFINSYRLCSGIPPQLLSTADTNSRRKSQIMDSFTENETASPVFMGSRQETVKENSDQLISEVSKTQRKR